RAVWALPAIPTAGRPRRPPPRSAMPRTSARASGRSPTRVLTPPTDRPGRESSGSEPSDTSRRADVASDAAAPNHRQRLLVVHTRGHCSAATAWRHGPLHEEQRLIVVL